MRVSCFGKTLAKEPWINLSLERAYVEVETVRVVLKGCDKLVRLWMLVKLRMPHANPGTSIIRVVDLQHHFEISELLEEGQNVEGHEFVPAVIAILFLITDRSGLDNDLSIVPKAESIWEVLWLWLIVEMVERHAHLVDGNALRDRRHTKILILRLVTDSVQDVAGCFGIANVTVVKED